MRELELAGAMRRLRRRRLALGPEVEPIRLPELSDLDLDMRVPGDKPAERCVGEAAPLGYWRPDGTIIGFLDGSPVGMEVAAEGEKILRDGRSRSIGRTTRYRSGVKLYISTIFLPIDHGWGQGDPILWESMVFHGHRRARGFGNGAEQWRYASREAALLGHRRIVHAITEANRARRAR